MAYTKKHFLKRVIDVQETVLEHTERGTSQIWVYRNIIYPKLHISRSTFNEYLAMNAKKELRELEEREKLDTQLKLFDD